MYAFRTTFQEVPFQAEKCYVSIRKQATTQVTYVTVILYKVTANRNVDIGRGPLNSLRLGLVPKEMVGGGRALQMEARRGAGHSRARSPCIWCARSY